jgi:hypothetical protein
MNVFDEFKLSFSKGIKIDKASEFLLQLEHMIVLGESSNFHGIFHKFGIIKELIVSFKLIENFGILFLG